MKYTLTADQQNLTLPWPDFHSKWNRPNPQLRWSFPQICLRTVASSNQQLHIFFGYVCIRHEVLALSREGMWQSYIAGRVGLTRATVNHILQRSAATGNLVQGQFTVATRKATYRQDRALFKVVQQDPFTSARGFPAWMRNLYGIMAGWKTIDNRLLPRGYCAYRAPQVRPCWLPTTAVGTEVAELVPPINTSLVSSTGAFCETT